MDLPKNIMPSRTFLSIIVLLASLILGVFLIIDGAPVEIAWLRLLSLVVTVLMFLLSFFDLFLWKFLPESLIKKPKIYGTWRGTIDSNWVDPETGKQIDPIECYTVIRQTFSTVSYRQMTAESTSDLVVSEIIPSPDKTFRLIGVYFNEPRILIQGRSPIHYGGIRMNVIGLPATKLSGEYWTSRNTAGELNLTERTKKFLHDFQSAKKAFIFNSDKERG